MCSRPVCYASRMSLRAGVVLLASLSAAACGGDQTRVRAAEIEQGKTLYAANGCGTCHGATGRGDGPVAKTLSLPPRDFRDAFKNGTDPGGLERHLLARFVISLRESDSAGAAR